MSPEEDTSATREQPAVPVDPEAPPEPLESQPAPEPAPAPEASADPFTPPPSERGSFGGTSPADADRAAHAQQADGPRPEIAAAGAFVGAFVFARILKRLGGSD